MKKLKLDLAGIGELLSKEQMKLVMGGGDDYGSYGDAKKCTTNQDCGDGQKCTGLQGIPFSICETIAIGTACTSNADCGNGQHCVNKPAPATGKWCNI